MGKINNISKLLSNETLQNILTAKTSKLKFEEINTIMKLLVSNNTPFTVSFSQGTQSSAAFFTITITLSPTTTLSTTIEIGVGSIDVP